MNNLAYHPKDLARLLNVSVKTLEKLRRTGGGPGYVKFGRRVVYPTKEVDIFLSKNVCHSTSEYHSGRIVSTAPCVTSTEAITAPCK